EWWLTSYMLWLPERERLRLLLFRLFRARMSIDFNATIQALQQLHEMNTKTPRKMRLTQKTRDRYIIRGLSCNAITSTLH
ncbi:hypothetical protein J7M28_02145, partial [bacterium]|nr:hypothetical protein [bacterium]